MAKSAKKTTAAKPKKVVVEKSQPVVSEQVVHESDREFRGLENVVTALFFIFVGSLLLLNTTGLVPWTIWIFLARFWPIFIILAGLRLIVGRSFVARVSVFAITTLLFGLIVVLGVMAVAPELLTRFNITTPTWLTDFVGNVWIFDTQSETSEFKLEKSDEAISEFDLSIDVGVGEFSLYDDYLGDSVFTVDSRYCTNFSEPDIEYTVEDSKAAVAFGIKDTTTYWFNNCDIFYEMTIEESDMLASVDAKIGAGKGTIAFEEQALKELSAEVGAGELLIELGEAVTVEENVNLNVGAGSIKLVVSEAVGVKISYNVGVGNIKVFGEDLGNIGADGTFTSDNYEAADHRIDITVDVGVGEFTLEYK